MQSILLLISTVFVQINISIAPFAASNLHTNLVISSDYLLAQLASTTPTPPKTPCENCEDKDARYCCSN